MTTTHYDALGIDRHATQDEIRRAYQRLALLHHPDRSLAREADLDDNVSNADALNQTLDKEDPFLRVQKAWEVLRDETSRREYDRDLLSKLGNGVVNAEVDLDDMDYDEAGESYRAPCRCGGEYVVTESQLEEGVSVVGCGTCSLGIRVLYRTVD
jgi:diphthamide biosynthesis protein 4